MSNIGNFKRVGREVVYKGKILEFCQDEIQTSKGHHVTWDFLNHKGAAAIVPVMDDGKILMVKQWRNVVRTEFLLKFLREQRTLWKNQLLNVQQESWKKRLVTNREEWNFSTQ